MIYGYKKGDAGWSKHDKYGVWSLKIEEKGGVLDGGLDLTELLRDSEKEEHGWWLWSSWFFCGLLLLVTKRYAKKPWVIFHFLHAALGYFVLIVTIVFSFKLARFEFADFHNILGLMTMFLTILGSLSGTLAASIMRFYNGDKPWSQQEKVQRIAKIHRWAGYLMLFVGNVCSMTGIVHYFGDFLQEDSKRPLGFVSLITFVIFVILCEVTYRIRNRYAMGHIKTPVIIDDGGKAKSYSASEIDTLVKEGKQLVVFDNLVLDLNGYERIHPGGKFNLIHNLGRDVSKFFFGGYNLVNGENKRPHHHSQPALDIVKTLVVGVLQS